MLNWSGRVPPVPPLSLPRYDLQTRIGGLSDPRSGDKISTHRAIATISLSYIYSPPSKQHILETNISASWIIKFRLLQSFAARWAVSRFLQQKLHMWHTYEIKVNLDKIIWQSDSSENIAYLRLLIFTLKSLPAPHNIQAVLYTLWATTEFAMMFVCLQ